MIPLWTILFAEDGPIAAITLNRPDDGNMFTAQMCLEIHDCIGRVRNETHTRVVVPTCGIALNIELTPTAAHHVDIPGECRETAELLVAGNLTPSRNGTCPHNQRDAPKCQGVNVGSDVTQRVAGRTVHHQRSEEARKTPKAYVPSQSGTGVGGAQDG